VLPLDERTIDAIGGGGNFTWVGNLVARIFNVRTMKEAVTFTSEAEFCRWFEKDPARLGVKRILLLRD
jgi:hypothetical protein